MMVSDETRRRLDAVWSRLQARFSATSKLSQAELDDACLRLLEAFAEGWEHDTIGAGDRVRLVEDHATIGMVEGFEDDGCIVLVRLDADGDLAHFPLGDVERT